MTPGLLEVLRLCGLSKPGLYPALTVQLPWLSLVNKTEVRQTQETPRVGSCFFTCPPVVSFC